MKFLKKTIINLLPSALKGKIKWYFASNQLVRGDAHWAKNVKYDLETKTIIQQTLKSDSIAIDIGAGEGEFTIEMSKYIRSGEIHSFEPIPASLKILTNQTKRLPQCKIYDFPLFDVVAKTEFNIVVKNHGYSGLKITEDASKLYGEQVELLAFETNTIDNLFQNLTRLDFIKIDVEGAEYHILKGGLQTINKFKPTIVFEFMSHAKAYDVNPEMIFDLLKETGLNLYNLEYYIQGKDPLHKSDFVNQVHKGYEFYFVASVEPLKLENQFRFKI